MYNILSIGRATAFVMSCLSILIIKEWMHPKFFLLPLPIGKRLCICARFENKILVDCLTNVKMKDDCR
jgi:hypothetical protein